MRITLLLSNTTKVVTRWLVTAASLSYLVITTSLAQAEDITADKVQISTPVYQPDAAEFYPALGKYTYAVGWQGIPAAETTINVERRGDLYHVTTEARTLSGIDLLYRLRYRAEGVLSAQNFQPKKTSITQDENSRKKITEITYLESGEVKSYRLDHKGKESRLQFDPENEMLEPFSAAFLARSLPWQIGMARQFDTFNGKSRYLLTLTAADKITMKVNGRPKEVWVIEPTVKNLTNPAKDKKLRSAQIYVTADINREILQIKSSVFIGSVFAKLKTFEPADDAQGRASFLAKAVVAPQNLVSIN